MGLQTVFFKPVRHYHSVLKIIIRLKNSVLRKLFEVSAGLPAGTGKMPSEGRSVTEARRLGRLGCVGCRTCRTQGHEQGKIEKSVQFRKNLEQQNLKSGQFHHARPFGGHTARDLSQSFNPASLRTQTPLSSFTGRKIWLDHNMPPPARPLGSWHSSFHVLACVLLVLLVCCMLNKHP